MVNLLVGARIYVYSVQAAEKDDPYPHLKLLSLVMEEVRSKYVDADKLTYQELIHGALKGMLATLDPHSEFMEPTKYDDLRRDTEGAFGGVGIVISVESGSVTVVSPYEDTPGYKAGIRPGDRILKIDGKSTDKFTLQDAVKRLRGEPGSSVTLSINRPSSGEFKEFTLVR